MLPHNDLMNSVSNAAAGAADNAQHLDRAVYRAIVEATPTPLVVLDALGRSVVANDAFVTLLASLLADSMGDSASDGVGERERVSTQLDQWPKVARAAAQADIDTFWQAQDPTRTCCWSVAGQRWHVTLTRLPTSPQHQTPPKPTRISAQNQQQQAQQAQQHQNQPPYQQQGHAQQGHVQQGHQQQGHVQQAYDQQGQETLDTASTVAPRATDYLLINVTAVQPSSERTFQRVAHEANPYEVWWLDSQGRLLEVHPPATHALPLLSRDASVGKFLSDYFKLPAVRLLRQWLEQVRQAGQIQRVQLDMSSPDTQRVYALRMIPVANGEVIVYVVDISPTQQKMAELQASHDKLQAFYEATPDIVLRVNRQGMYLDAHIPEHFTSLYDDYESLHGLYISQVLEPAIANPSLQYLDMALRTGEVQTFNYQVFVAGSLRYREARIAPLDSEEALWFTRDVTNQKRAEQQLEQSERLFRSFFEDSPTPYMIILYDELTKHPNGAMVNAAFEEFLGYKQEDINSLNIDYFLQMISHNEDYTLEQRVADGLRRRNIMSYRLVKRNFRADGDTVWSDFTNITFNDDQGQPLRTFCVFQDITDRIEAEDQLRESREQLELALDAANLMVWNWHVHEDRFVARGNLPHNKDLDSPLMIDDVEALLARIHPDDRLNFQSHIDACLAGKRFGFEVVFRLNSAANSQVNANTVWRWVLSVGSGSDHDDHGRPGQLSGVLQDIHTRKLTELRLEETLAELEHALGEKTLLLAEVHHRVKNNMQVLGSLLSLQSREIEDPVAKEAIKASQARVRAMAAVHEVMYHNERFSDLNVKNYIEKVSFVMQRALAARDITLEFHLQDVNITIQEAIPCGLVFNELLSNALKHAFPETLPEDHLAAATVTVTLDATDTPPDVTLDHSSDSDNDNDSVVYYTGTLAANMAGNGQSWVRLCVTDNGVGMVSDTPSNFGTFLIETLVDQLQGVLELRSQPERGTQWCLTFPNQHPQPQRSLDDDRSKQGY
jgi:PAS domain S-box-containing protein